MVIILWVASAAMIKSIFNEKDTNFPHPLFLTYFSTSFFTLYLIPLLINWTRLKAGKKEEELAALKVQLKYIVKLSFIFCMFWFAANYFYNLGLVTTSVASSTVLSNTSAIFVFLIELLILREGFSVIKMIFVLVSFSGVLIITLSDRGSSSTEDHSYIGDIFSLVSSFCYGLYATYLKVKVPPEQEAYFKFSYFLGFVGLTNMVVLLPLFPIFHYAGIEPFSFPNKKALLFLAINAFFGTFLSDYCWARSVVLLGSLITTLGMSLNMPISMVVSSLFEHMHFHPLYYVGTVCIFSAFVVIALVDFYRAKQKEKEQEEKKGEGY